jgi:hypothetical protein
VIPIPARLTAAFLLALPLAARPAAPGEPLRAARVEAAPAVDGRLEEPAWDQAPPFGGFVQRFPDEGAAPTAGTTVRVLYDDRMLYVGVSCNDGRPDLVQRPLGRRDNAPFGDSVTIFLDSMHSGRTAFVFSISAAGVQSDGLQSDDDEYNGEWDAIWDGATAATSQGWSAELAIPFTALRFQDHGEPVFGFAVKRVVGRSHEEAWSVVIPRSARGQIRRLAELEGLAGLGSSAELEVAPYAAARLSLQPQYDDWVRPKPRLLEPTGDLGVDLKTALGRGLSLQGTLNPDFGQVEADQVVQNLSTFESFFPEKRPFFTQGMDLFRPVAPQGRPSPQQLFYSRRIGLSAPILAAAKLSGSASDALQVGLVEAFVAGESAGRDEAHPDRGYRFSASRPLWLGPRSALPQRAPPSVNYLAAVGRWQPSPTVAAGATFTSAVLGGPRCSRAESREGDDDLRPLRCDALGGEALALDLALRTPDGEWFLRGQATGSRSRDGTALRTLPDGTQLRRGDLGWGAHAALGRAGGEPWRYELHWEYESPRLDVNAVGYQRTQNEQLGRAILRYVRPTGGGPFHSFAAAAASEARYTTDGRGLLRGAQLYLGTEFQLRSFDWFGFEGWYDVDHWDVRELDQASVDQGHAAAPLAQQRPGDAGADVWLNTDPSRAVALEAGGGGGRSFALGGSPATGYWWLYGKLALRPHPRIETRIEVAYEANAWRSRYVTDDGAASPRDREYLFADLTAPDLSITLRQQLVLTPRLTLQAYAQLFTSAGRYGRFRVATPRGGKIRFRDLKETSGSPDQLGYWDNPDFRSGTLMVNVVLRWEYRLGSTLFLVYSRAQEELGYPDDAHDPSPPDTLGPRLLGPGPTSDVFLVKWSYWWSR